MSPEMRARIEREDERKAQRRILKDAALLGVVFVVGAGAWMALVISNAVLNHTP